MNEPLLGWQARIEKDYVCGAGVLVPGGRVLTCAHVVAGVLEGDSVRVTFPGALETVGVTATLMWKGGWREAGNREDIALLTLDRVPDGARPCAFAELGALELREGQSQCGLYAHGFPANHDENGLHVDVSTSAGKALGRDGEWLQVNVEGINRPQLARGFSGGGIYLPDTLKVVGLLSDADLDQDLGYWGKMLPLATIRKYWEEIDDYLSLFWSPDRAYHTDLRAAVVGAAVPTSFLQSAVITTSFVRDTEEFTTVWQAIRFVAEAMPPDGSRDRIFRFLEAIAPRLDDTAGQRLVNWARRYERDWAERIEKATHPRTSIVVMLRDPEKGSEADLEVSARAWVNEEWAGPVRTETVGKDRENQHGQVKQKDLVKQAVRRLVSAIVHERGPAKVMLEFAVRREDLTLEFDEWDYDSPDYSEPQLMGSEPLVVWDVKRLDGASYSLSDRMRKRWDALHDGKAAWLPVDCAWTYGYRDFLSLIQAKPAVGALAYSANPRADWLTAALEEGVPVMIWCRQECSETTHGVHEELRARVRAAFAMTDPDRLPDVVAELRKVAHSPDDDGTHAHGKHLTLLYDNPNRVYRRDPPLGGGR